MATINRGETIRIQRFFGCSPEILFNAFTRSRAIEQWLAPSDAIKAKVLSYEFSVGGRYRIEFTLPDGQRSVLGGEFVLIEPHCQLIFSWEWEAPDPHAGINSLVTIGVHICGEGCELELTHESLDLSAAVERHTEGWNGALDRLNRFITKRQ
ncbi:uncharacterized protein YndB with AHSA1/START domain [Alteromonadaceae bacterium 2753L.S.0a.02]|nr:uncharacterized protein YndB with AHSA1/START domain [Alteromonadaceae bacterium 2753L.S.0a.02]